MQPPLMLLLLLLLLLAAGGALSAPPCGEVCEITDRNISASELAASVGASTTELRLRRVTLLDWPPAASLSGVASLTLEEVLSESKEVRRPLATFPNLRRLRAVGAWPFDISDSSPAVADVGSLTELRLERLRIGKLDDSWLANLASLANLSVAGCVMESLGPATLQRHAPSLRRLAVSDCNVTTLRNETFGQLGGLEQLTLDGNAVYYIHKEAFAGLQQLRELSVVLPRDRQLAKIWEPSLAGRFASNRKLRVLRLVDARLSATQIKDAFAELGDLRELDLRGNRFEKLEIGVLSSLVQLRSLDLSRGALTCLYNRNFGLLGQLRHLNLSHNRIEIVSQLALGGLKSLTSLDLAGNPVRAIAEGAFCSLDALKTSPGLLQLWGFERSVYRGANVSEACPEGLDPDKINIQQQRCAMPPREPPQHHAEQSKHTFLIIIGLCVAFLLVTVISMMAYKGWSKRKNAEMAKDEEKELELQAMVTEQPDTSKKAQNGRSKPRKQQQQQQQQQHSEANGAIETQAQVQQAAEAEVAPDAKPPADDASAPTPAPAPAPASSSASATAPTAASASAAKPRVTQMTTVPEDGDIDGRDVTTLVVV